METLYKDKIPNFLICGAAQSGTSFLYSALKQHPEVFVPASAVPEPHFFLKDWEYEKGMQFYLDQWFGDVDTERARGEKSSSYLYGGVKVAQRIYRDLQEVKLIVMLRNPVDRAWGHYRFSCLNGIESLSFYDALDQEDVRIAQAEGQWKVIKPFDYTGRSRYGYQLTEFLKVFPRDRILVIKSEMLKQTPEEIFRRIFSFLNVDKEFTPSAPPPFTSPDVIDPSLQAQCRAVFQDRFGEILRQLRAGEEDVARFAQNERELDALNKLQSNITHRKLSLPKETRFKIMDKLSGDFDLLKSIVDFPINDWY